MVRNHYLLLGIPPDASQHQIKSVYRSLAKRFHPDRNKGSEAAAELFRQVNDAYRTLSDPTRRAEYDQRLQQQRELSSSPAAPVYKDPQQKFNKFISSLLDALLGPGNPPPTRKNSGTSLHQNAKGRSRNRTSTFIIILPVKKRVDYDRGEDGIYRRTRKRATTSTQNRYRR